MGFGIIFSPNNKCFSFDLFVSNVFIDYTLYGLIVTVITLIIVYLVF